jgi:hypothetical protein
MVTIMSMVRDYFYELGPQTGLLFIPLVIYCVSMENYGGIKMATEEYSSFVHQRSLANPTNRVIW